MIHNDVFALVIGTRVQVDLLSCCAINIGMEVDFVWLLTI